MLAEILLTDFEAAIAVVAFVILGILIGRR
jgi:hypothetical protein